MQKRERWILGACFLISGGTSLVLQIAWSKELSYILGNTLYAVATVVAAFMAGLGIGSALAGRFAERLKNPVGFYARLQFGIAACGMFSIPVFRATEPLFRYLYQTFDPGQGAFLLARFAAVFVLMLLPVILMGMTLPVVVGAYARRKEKYGFEAGLMYGINTLGAVAGTWAAGFFLLPWFGLWKTCVAIGTVDALVGLAALYVNKRAGAIEDIRRAAHKVVAYSQPWNWRQWGVGAVFAASGAVALAYEVSWFRLLGLTMGPSVYAFSVMLGMFLLGVGLGSAVSAGWAERTRLGGIGAMALLEGLLAIVCLFGLFYYNKLPKLNFEMFMWATERFGENGFYLGQMGVAAAAVLAPCLIMGALFPVAVRAVREASDGVAPEANVGRLYVMNTFGGIAGSLVTGFFLVPEFGMWNTFLGASLVSAVLCAALCLMVPREILRKRAAYAAASLVVAGGLAWASPDWDINLFNQGLYREVYSTSRYDVERARAQKLLYYREGVNSPVAVFNTGGEGTLRVAGKADASTMPVDRYTQLFVGHLPVLFTENPRRAAVIGYGSGMSAMAMLANPEVDVLDIIEIEKGVIEASPFFECINFDPLSDPRARLVLEDGRVHMTYTGEVYDVITSEPSNPWMAGVSNLFTKDFYRIVRARLAPEGVFGQWIQTYELDETIFKTILASLHDVFPHVVVFRSGVGDMVVLASGNPIQVPWEKFRDRFYHPDVYESFAMSDVRHPFHLFFYFHGPEEAIREFLADARTRNTDDNVWLEYRMPQHMVQLRRAAGARERNIGTTIINAGAPMRLSGFMEMVPGLPVEECVRESLAYQYSREDVVIDHWAPVRSAIVSGLRAELAQMGEERLLADVNRWVNEGETRMQTRTAVVQEIIQDLQQGRAAETLRRAVEQVPDLPMVPLLYGNVLFSRGDFAGAAEHYHRTLDFRWSNAYYDALIGLGNVAINEGRIEEARGFYERAARHNPYQPAAFRSWAMSLLWQDNPEAARAALEEGLRFNPGHTELTAVMASLPPSPW